MFDWLTDSVDNALSVADAVMTGEDIKQRQIAKLIADGMTVASAAAIVGVSADVLESLLKSDK